MLSLEEGQAVLSGQSLNRRVEDARLITGTGNYVDDRYQKRMAHASILRSPYAHAKIKRIDLTEALALPGVMDILTGTEALLYTKPYPQAFELPVRDYCFAVDEVVYVGQPVAAVVAENKSIAEDAISLVRVEYEVLKPVTDARLGAENHEAKSHTSLKESRIFHKKISYGNLNEVFSKADLVVSESLVFESYSAMPLETYAIIADYNKTTGMLMIYDNSQAPLYTGSNVSHVLSIPPNRIRFIEQDIGGGFGTKTMIAMYVILISLLSIRTGVPVKWVETRSEHMMASSHGSRRQYDVQLAVMKSGEITGLKVKAFEDVGAFVRRPAHTALISCLRSFSGPYRFRTFQYDMNMVLTNKCPAGPSRGNGKNHHAFLLERMIDRVARELKLDSAQVRLRNFIRPEEFPYVTVNGCLYDSGDYPTAFLRVAELIGYRNFRAEQMKLESQEGRHLGLGFALTVDPAASNMSQDAIYQGQTEKWGTSETASIHMDNTGNVTVALGSVPQGQGHETVATSLVSEILGVSPNHVTVFTGFDSARNIGTPTSGTYSSRFAPICSNAIVLAAREIRNKLLRTASRILNATVEDLTIERGQIRRLSDSSVAIPVREIANLVYSGAPDRTPVEERSLDSTVTYSYPYGRNKEEAISNLASTYAYQAHAAVVEVDIETGKVKILRYAIVDDSGRSLNKMIVEGQVHGGAYNGIAAALFEKFVYDDDGQIVSSTFNDYLAPTAMDIPDMKVELLETSSPFTPTGAKGVGESGALGPQPAITNAIEDSLHLYGVKILQSHVTPEMILNMIHHAKVP